MLMEKYVSNYYIDELYDKYYFSKGKKIAWDTETTGLDFFNGARIFSFSFTFSDYKTSILRIDGRDGSTKSQSKLKLKKAKKILENEKNVLISHNSIFDTGMCVYDGINISKNTLIHDTMRMHQLLRNDYHTHKIKHLGYIYFEFTKKYDDLIEKLNKKCGGYQYIPNHIMSKYQYADSYRCMLLYDLLWPELRKNEQLLRIYINEMLMIWVCLDIQKTGLKTDKIKAKNLVQWLEKEKNKSVRNIKNKTGMYLDIYKDGVVPYILQNHLNIKLNTKTKTGRWCTNKEVMHEVRKKYILDNKKNPEKYSLIDDIIKIRSYRKGITDINKYITLSDENNILHSSQKPNTAKTGRQGTENPNASNISKSKPTEERPFPIPARSIFYPLDNCVTFLIDYDAQEMMLIAEVSQDVNMIKLINKGGDPHASAAALFYGKLFTSLSCPDKIKTLRGYAKTVHFAMAYGANLKTLFQKFQVFDKLSQAKKALERYEKVYPKIRWYSKSQKAKVQKTGMLITPFGRQLLINPEKSFEGANHLIQATGADILKYSEVRLSNYFNDVWNNKIKIMFPLHDELGLAVHKSILFKVNIWKPAISTIMTTFPEFKIKLKVDWNISTKSWDKKKKWVI